MLWKPCKWWDKLPTSTGERRRRGALRASSPGYISGGLSRLSAAPTTEPQPFAGPGAAEGEGGMKKVEIGKEMEKWWMHPSGERFRAVQGGGGRSVFAFPLITTWVKNRKASLLRRVHKSRSRRPEASEVAACGWTPLKVLLGDAQSLGKNKFGCAIFGSNCQEIEHILQLQQQLVLLVLVVLMLILILVLTLMSK